jgi:hypothetical protein
MIRVEIIANHSVEENILEAFALEDVGKFYTKYPNVFGVGNSGPRMGDAVWPEENFALIIWCEEDEAQGIARAVASVKKQFPDEGIRIFGIPAGPSRFPHVMAGETVRPAAHAEVHAEVRTAPQPVVHVASPVYTPAPVPPAAPPAYTPPAAPAYTVPPAAPAPTAPPVYTPPPTPPEVHTPAAMPQTPAYTAPPAAPVPPAPSPAAPGPDPGISSEYDGQNMEN